MNKFIRLIFLLLIFTSCKDNLISDFDIAKAVEFNNQAVEFLMNGEREKAKESYRHAIEMDKNNVNYHYALIGLYNQEKNYKRSFELLDKMPIELRKTAFYFSTKGQVFELQNKIDIAIENYKKAYQLTKEVKLNGEEDVLNLPNFAMLETVSGNKTKALKRMNSAIDLKWISQSTIKKLEIFRNEIEFYQGNGYKDLTDFSKEIKICTNNPDSLIALLTLNHINFSGGRNRTDKANQQVYVTVGEKYRSGIEKLEIYTCK